MSEFVWALVVGVMIVLASSVIAASMFAVSERIWGEGWPWK